MTRRNVLKCSAIVLTVMAALATACGDDSGSSAATTGSASSQPTTITLLTHDAFAVSKGVLEGFTEQTGITVKVLQAGDAGAMVNQAILTKGKPLGDVLYGVDNTFLTRAVDAGIFEPYSSPGLSDVDDQFAEGDAGILGGSLGEQGGCPRIVVDVAEQRGEVDFALEFGALLVADRLEEAAGVLSGPAGRQIVDGEQQGFELRVVDRYRRGRRGQRKQGQGTCGPHSH